MQVGGGSRPIARQLAEVMLPPDMEEANPAVVAMMTALPFGLAAGWMLLLAKSSQKSGARMLAQGLCSVINAIVSCVKNYL